MQEEMEGMRVDMGKMELGNQEMLRMNQQLALEKQQLINRRNLEICEKDLMINVRWWVMKKLEQSLGFVQQSQENKPEKTKIKQHHRRKSDQPVRSYIKDKKHSFVTKIKK